MRSFHSRAVGGQRGQLDHILVIGRIFWTLDTPYKGIQASLRGGRNVSRRNLSQEEMELLERAQGRRGPRRSKNAVFRVIGSGLTDSIESLSRMVAPPSHHLRFGELRAVERGLRVRPSSQTDLQFVSAPWRAELPG